MTPCVSRINQRVDLESTRVYEIESYYCMCVCVERDSAELRRALQAGRPTLGLREGPHESHL